MHRKFSAWWVGRVLLYWIPVIFIYYSLASICSDNYSSFVTNLVLAISIIMLLEHYVFGYQVNINNKIITYTEGLFLFKKVISFSKLDVKSATYLSIAGGLPKLRSDRLLVELNDNRHVTLSLASFRPRDSKFISNWLLNSD